MTHAITAAAERRDVELARTGSWNLSSGPLSVTPQMLDDAARFANRAGARPAYLKIGHTDKRFTPGDGEPALGWIHNVRVEQDDQGHVLKGDLSGMPEWLAAAMPHHWPDRSIEGWADYEHDGDKYGLVIEALALLGITPPGMASIRSLRDLPAALGIAASGRRVIASMAAPKTSAAPRAGEPPTTATPTSEGAGMDPVLIREALGLAADASDDELKAAIVTAGLAPPESGSPVAAAATPGTVVLASSTYEQLLKDMKTLTDHVAKTKRDERDEVIAQAVRAGKFTPAQREHFSAMWDSNPDAARKLIEVMTPNHALAVVASGYAGDVEGEEDELDREIARLSDPARKVA